MCLSTIKNALPEMSDYEKGYFLGVAETRVAQNKESRKVAAEKK